MPQLREWIVNFPTYWTTLQARAYLEDTTAALHSAMVPVTQALGPNAAASVLLVTLASLVRANPVYAHDIQGQLANTYDLVQQVTAASEGTKH